MQKFTIILVLAACILCSSLVVGEFSDMWPYFFFRQQQQRRNSVYGRQGAGRQQGAGGNNFFNNPMMSWPMMYYWD